MARKLRSALVSCVSFTAVLIVAAPLQSQEIVLDPIVVSGEKIDRPYLETTTSVGVVTARDLDDYSVPDVLESFNRLANVRLLDADGGNDTFSIRGLNGDGVSEIGNIVPLVSVIIDGAVQNSEGTRRGARSSWDLKQIEVLRGPQSSLYGRAALAGALVIESNDPSYKFESAVKGDVYSFKGHGGAFMLNGPIVKDQFAVRVSGEMRKGENNINYTDPGNRFFGEDEFRNIRAKGLFEPKALPGLRVLFTFNRAYDSPDSTGVSGPNFFARTQGGAATFSEAREVDVDNFIWNASYAFSDAYTVRSTSTITKTDLLLQSSPTSPVFVRLDTREGDDFTQDVRLEISDHEGSGVSGVVGGFFGQFTQDTNTNIQVDSGVAAGGAPSGFLVPLQVGTFGSDIETLAAYADLRYNFFGPWSLIGGLRYQNDKVNSAANVQTLLAGPLAFDLTAEFDVWLPKFGLAFDIDDNQSIAVTASRGYRSGFTEIDASTGTQNTISPEFVWTYEASYRFVSTDQRASFGANAFYNRYKDQQITVFSIFPATRTSNAGRSESYGAELEGRYNFDIGLNVFASLGLLKTKILDFPDSACAPSGGNCAGNQFPEAPQVTFAAGGVYQHDSGWFVSADGSYTGSYFSGGDINNTSTRKVDDFFVANAKVGYRLENLSASVYVKNVFDEKYLTSIAPSLMEATVGDSRVAGFELRVKL